MFIEDSSQSALTHPSGLERELVRISVKRAEDRRQIVMIFIGDKKSEKVSGASEILFK
jgi:hypothetical protein